MPLDYLTYHAVFQRLEVLQPYVQRGSFYAFSLLTDADDFLLAFITDLFFVIRGGDVIRGDVVEILGLLFRGFYYAIDFDY